MMKWNEKDLDDDYNNCFNQKQINHSIHFTTTTTIYIYIYIYLSIYICVYVYNLRVIWWNLYDNDEYCSNKTRSRPYFLSLHFSFWWSWWKGTPNLTPRSSSPQLVAQDGLRKTTTKLRRQFSVFQLWFNCKLLRRTLGYAFRTPSLSLSLFKIV